MIMTLTESADDGGDNQPSESDLIKSFLLS